MLSFPNFLLKAGAFKSHCGHLLKASASRLGSQGAWPDRRGSVAVEFALVAPLFLILTFGVYAASFVMATMIGIEQITAGAARNAVGGLTDAERQSLVYAYVSNNASSYAYIDPARLSLSLFSNPATAAFTVTATYDMSSSGFYAVIKSVVPTLQPVISRSATIQQGGY